ncbi:MAG: hypothetical protein RLZZ67_535 [Candidatus Parcubacteria bacterium]|jgi:hypothetical protein
MKMDYTKEHMKEFFRMHKVSLILLVLLFIIFISYLLLARGASDMDMSLGEHVTHLKQAQDNLKNPRPLVRKFSVSINKPDKIIAGVPTQIDFTVYDSTSGDQVTAFDVISEKLLHLIVVNDSLTSFDHVHPTFDGSKFSISYTFPKNDAYRLYLDFKPEGSDENQFAFKVPVGTTVAAFDQKVFDTSLSKDFSGYTVAVSGSFKALDIVSGTSPFVFTIKNIKTGEPVTDLRPYLGSFGHMVMINTKDYSYIHVHPIDQDLGDDRGGPEVKFQPMALGTSSLVPGVYRVFAQFQPTSGLFTSDFIVEVK